MHSICHFFMWRGGGHFVIANIIGGMSYLLYMVTHPFSDIIQNQNLPTSFRDSCFILIFIIIYVNIYCQSEFGFNATMYFHIVTSTIHRIVCDFIYYINGFKKIIITMLYKCTEKGILCIDMTTMMLARTSTIFIPCI